MEQIYVAAAYCRLSKDDPNDGTSVSIETQKTVISEFCQEYGIAVYDYYCDDGWSGANFDRPGFKSMIKEIGNGTVNLVIVKDLSRLGRESTEVNTYVERYFPEHGIHFTAIGEGIGIPEKNKSGLEAWMHLHMKSFLNEFYLADSSEKVRQAFKAKAKKGEFIGSHAPYGMKKSPTDKHVLMIDEETAPTVKWIVEMAAYQGYGYNKIAKVLTERKVITPMALRAKRSGLPYEKDPYEWNLATVAKMLDNREYIGDLVSGQRTKLSFKSKKSVKTSEDEWIKNYGTHEALIPRQLWDDAHMRLSERKRTNSSGFVNIFAGLIKCDRCGYALGISSCKDRDVYYTCNSYSKKGRERCSIHYIMYKDLYDVVLNDLRKMLSYAVDERERFRKTVFQQLNDLQDTDKVNALNESDSLAKKLDDLNAKYNMVYNDRLDGIISNDKFKEYSEKINSEIKSVEERLSKLKAKLSAEEENIANMERFIGVITEYESIDELDKELLNRLIERITVSDRVKRPDGSYDQTITIKYRFLGEINM